MPPLQGSNKAPAPAGKTKRSTSRTADSRVRAGRTPVAQFAIPTERPRSRSGGASTRKPSTGATKKPPSGGSVKAIPKATGSTKSTPPPPLVQHTKTTPTATTTTTTTAAAATGNNRLSDILGFGESSSSSSSTRKVTSSSSVYAKEVIKSTTSIRKVMVSSSSSSSSSSRAPPPPLPDSVGGGGGGGGGGLTAVLDKSSTTLPEAIDVDVNSEAASESPAARHTSLPQRVASSSSSSSEASKIRQPTVNAFSSHGTVEVIDPEPDTPVGVSAGVGLSGGGNVQLVPPARSASDTYSDQWQGDIDDGYKQQKQSTASKRHFDSTPEQHELAAERIMSAVERSVYDRDQPRTKSSPKANLFHKLDTFDDINTTTTTNTNNNNNNNNNSEELRDLRHQLAMANQKLSFTEDQLTEAKETIASLKSEQRAEATKHFEELRTYEAMKEDNDHLKNEVERLRDGVSAGWTEQEHLRKQIGAASGNHRSAEADLVSQRASNEVLQRKLDLTTDELSRSMRECSAAQRTAVQLQVEAEALQLDMHKQKAYLEEFREGEKAAKESLYNYRLSTETELESLREQLESARDELALYRTCRSCGQQDGSVGRHERHNDTSVSVNHADCEITIQMKNEQISTLKEELERERYEKHQVIVSSSKALMDAKQNDDLSVNARVRLADEELASVKDTLTRVERERHELREANSKLSAENKVLTGQLEAAEIDRDKTQQSYWDKLLGRCEEIMLNGVRSDPLQSLSSIAAESPVTQMTSPVASERGMLSPDTTTRPVSTHMSTQPPPLPSMAPSGHHIPLMSRQMGSPPRLAGRSPSPGLYGATPTLADPRPASSPPRRATSAGNRNHTTPTPLRRC